MNTKELFEEIKSKIIVDLQPDEVVCPECKGLRFNYKQEGEKGYVKSCERCYTGKLFICEYCGEKNKSRCNCEGTSNAFRQKEDARLLELMKKSKVITFAKWDGFMASPTDSELIQDKSDFKEEYLDYFDKDSPKMVFATTGEAHFNLDIKEIIYDKAEDGYEDMNDNLDMGSGLLISAQKLLDKWKEENAEAMKIYCEDVRTCIDLTELYEEGMKGLEE